MLTCPVGDGVEPGIAVKTDRDPAAT